MNKRFSAGLIIAYITVVVAITALAKTTYKIIVPVAEGLSVGSVSSMMKNAGETLTKKTGYDIKVVDIKAGRDGDTFEKVFNAVKNKEGHFTYLSSTDYVRHKDRVDDVMKPLFTLLVNGKPYTNVCAYVRKGDSAKSVKSLKGETWGGAGLVPTNWLLYRNEIDGDALSFFGKNVYIVDMPSTKLLDALLDKKIDVFVLNDFMAEMSIKTDVKYKKGVRRLDCEKFDHNFIFFYRKGMPKKVVKAVQKNFLGAHKDKDYAQFKFLFAAINGRFAKYNAKNLTTTKKIVDVAEKKGWYEQEIKFVKDNVK